jgi:hypothetical protein
LVVSSAGKAAANAEPAKKLTRSVKTFIVSDLSGYVIKKE